jgi:hypothetical protein
MMEIILQVCPGCNYSFHPKHGNQIFCSDKCYHTYYNRNVRDKSHHYITSLHKNIGILEELMSTNSELIIPYIELIDFKFDFYIYSERIPHNKLENLFYLTYGKFITNLTDNESIFIKQK